MDVVDISVDAPDVGAYMVWIHIVLARMWWVRLWIKWMFSTWADVVDVIDVVEDAAGVYVDEC